MPKSVSEDEKSTSDSQSPLIAEPKSSYDTVEGFRDDGSPLTISETISYGSDSVSDQSIGQFEFGEVDGSTLLSPTVRLASLSLTPITDVSPFNSPIPTPEGKNAFSSISLAEDNRVSPSYSDASMPTSEFAFNTSFDPSSYGQSGVDPLLVSGSKKTSHRQTLEARTGDADYLKSVSESLSKSAQSMSQTSGLGFTEFGLESSAFETPPRNIPKKDEPADMLAARRSSKVVDSIAPLDESLFDNTSGYSLFIAESEQVAKERALNDHKQTMRQFAKTLGYFPVTEEWDEILAELGGIDKITVGKNTYNVHVAKDFLHTFRKAFCYLGRPKTVKHDPHLFTTLAEELLGSKFKGTNHAIKAWTDVFMNFNAIRIVLAMKIDKLKKKGYREGSAKAESPVISRLMHFLDMVREFEKDVWRMLPKERQDALKQHFSQSSAAMNHLKAVELCSPPRSNFLERSLQSPLMGLAESRPAELYLVPPKERLSRRSPLCDELRKSPVLQKTTYRGLNRSSVLDKRKNITPSQTIANKVLEQKNQKNPGPSSGSERQKKK